MNLIEKLGLEKCRAIVDGAPEGVTHYWGSIKGEYAQKSHITHCSSILGDEGGSSTKVYKNETWTTYHSSGYPNLIDLNDLRTAIANHEKCQHEWNETTSNGDAYRFFVCKHCDSTQNYVPFKDDNPSHFDHCSDIKNHISPLTGVIER